MTLELPSGRNLASEPEEYAAFLKQKAMIDALRGATVPDSLMAATLLPVVHTSSP